MMEILTRLAESLDRWTTYTQEIQTEDGVVKITYPSANQQAIGRVVSVLVLGIAVALSFMPNLNPQIMEQVDALMRIAGRL